MTIPANVLVNITPSVISAGGTGINLCGVVLSNSARIPVGATRLFINAASASTFFGPSAPETAFATQYFLGFDGSQIKPAFINFASYQTAAVGAWILSAPVTLAQVIAAGSGTIALTVNGTLVTSASINLAAASSLSNAASLITTGLANANAICTYDSISGGFLISNAITGATSTYTYCTGTLSALLGLTQATGAIISQGAIASSALTAMTSVVALTTNFATFATIFQPSSSDMVNFATWANGQNNRYMYVCWDNNITATTYGDTTSALYLIKNANLGSAVYIYDPVNPSALAAFAMGSIASVDYTQTNGRATLAGRSQANIVPGQISQLAYQQLLLNGGNCYTSFAAATQNFLIFEPGQITGPFLWIDSFADQIWLNSNLQLILLSLITIYSRRIPYNLTGYTLIAEAISLVIAAAIKNGVITAGTTLTTSEIIAVNNAAGQPIDSILASRGWYLQILDPGGVVRAARGSPIINLWYTDGQSVQTISMNSVEIQ